MIKIGNYIIKRLDRLNWIIEEEHVSEKGKAAGKAVTRTLTYHPTLSAACVALFRLGVGDDQAEDLEGLMEAVRASEERIIEAVSSIGIKRG